MSSSDPSRERITIWTYTEDEIFHRWEIHQRFDLLNRYASAFKKEEAKKAVVDNSGSALAFLESALPEQGEYDGD